MNRKINRRDFLSSTALSAAGLAAAGLALAGPAMAQAYPSKPIRIIVPFGAGSSTDIVTRIIAAPLSQALGQPVIVENKPGADGAIAGVEVKRATPDGHTLLMATNSPLSAVPYLQKQQPYDVIADFTPISHVGFFTFFLVTHPSVEAKTLPELIAYAKANPGKLNYATGNTTSIVATALLAKLAGIDMVQVPYKTEPQAMTDLFVGQTQLMISSYSPVAAHIKDGKLRAIVTTLSERSGLLPDVPSLAEVGFKDFPVVPWAAVVGPAAMPKEIVERLNKELVTILGTPDIKEQINKQAFAVKSSSPAELGMIIKDQLEVWGRVMKEAGIERQ
jgi:tripartite-type tricarboxylate transporter receptor subunit TctC